MAARGRDAQYLGRMLRDEPASLPGEMLHRLKLAINGLWKARGGGFYACGFVVTFLFLEVRMFVTDVIGAESFTSFVSQQLLETVFRFLSQSLLNSILAFIWPVYVIEFRPPWGIVALVLMYVIFAFLLKEPLERWLFAGQPGANEDSASPE